MYEVKKTKIKVKNFDTYAVEGIMPDGTRGLLVNLVSKKSELVVQIVVNYLFGNREKSFAENPDRKPNHETRKQKIQKRDQKDPKPTKDQLKEQQRQEKERQYQEKRRKGEIFDA